ncbi:unnamed protein product [Cyprideis torosa]|uniref:Transporter n=1 Tax=Cyprideis torosa TaxID=163714 RepID=A0A7R8W1A3_9CRUS|nr:unnamed protein product [Cyprideis torosa]CAG0880639.1 unnamed protein product [Cyprideis torosa]
MQTEKKVNSESEKVQMSRMTNGTKEPNDSAGSETSVEAAPKVVSQTSSANVSVSIKEGDASQTRGTWTGRLDFLLACVSYAVGLGNIWRFPYYCFKNGGGTFLLAYLVCVFCLGIPIFFLEISMGQYFTLSNIRVLEKVAPIFKGAGLASQVMVAWINTYYNVITAWAIAYLVQSALHISELPWKSCTGEYWETSSCYDPQSTTNFSNESVPIVEEFWENRILQMTDGIENIGGLQWELVGFLFLAWAITYFIIWKGLHSSGKILWITATFPYFILFILFFRGITLEGAMSGLYFYLVPDPVHILSPSTWLDAGSQVCYSYGIAIGTLYVMGSYNDRSYNCQRDAFLVGSINSGTSLFGGLVTFSILGHMAHNRGVDVADVVSSGPGLAFLTYPEVASSLPGGSLWSILFFLMLLCLGIDTAFCMVDGFVTSLADLWPRQLHARRKLFAFVTCFLFFLCGIPQVTRGGVYLFAIIDSYGAAGIALMVIGLCQNIALAWVFGVDEVNGLIEEMLGKRPHRAWGICWKYLGPALMTLIAVFFCLNHEPISYESSNYGTYQYPVWARVLCWVMAATSVSCIPGYALYFVLTTPLPWREAIKHGCTPKPCVKNYRMTPRQSMVQVSNPILVAQNTSSSRSNGSAENDDAKEQSKN